MIIKPSTKSKKKNKTKAELSSLEENYLRICKEHGITPHKKESFTFTPLSKSIPKLPPGRMTTTNIKSLDSDNHCVTMKNTHPKTYDDPLLQLREEQARKEIDFKKTCVAPYCNKGNYVYVTEGFDPSELGRKK